MHEIEGFILADGAISRMGPDKAKLKLGGKTFVERAALALSTIATKNITLVSEINQQPPKIKLPEQQEFELRVISDLMPEKQMDGANRPRAAIIGLYTALVRAETESLAVLACDLPFVSQELFERLVSLLQNDKAEINNYEAVVPVQADGKMQPLCELYSRAACLKTTEEILAGEDWSLQNLLRRVETYYISFDKIADLKNSEHFFFNANTPDDFNQAQQIEILKKAQIDFQVVVVNTFKKTLLRTGGCAAIVAFSNGR